MTGIEPFDLPMVKAEHLAGVFGDFRTVVERRISVLKETPGGMSGEKARFFEYLLSEVDPAQFAEVQRKHLELARGGPQSAVPKYIDPIVWFESKLMMARRLGLADSKPLRILDIGTGPGHFPVVARFYGHEVLGTDLPERSQGRGNDEHLYDALCDIYGVRRIPCMIQPFEPLGVSGPFNLVTALLAAFNVADAKRPWGQAEWDFFMKDIISNVLVEDGGLFMSLDDKKLTPEIWGYLKRGSAWALDPNKQIYFPVLARMFDAAPVADAAASR